MASKQLMKTVDSYEKYMEKHGVDDKAIHAYVVASEVAISEDNDVEYGLKCAARSKQLIEHFVKCIVGNDIYWLEGLAQKNKTNYEILNDYYDALRIEAAHIVKSFF